VYQYQYHNGREKRATGFADFAGLMPKMGAIGSVERAGPPPAKAGVPAADMPGHFSRPAKK
jgi:hypothetical protein